MAKLFKVRNPETKKIEKHTPQNAHDLVQHRGWQIVGKVIETDPDEPKLTVAQEMQKKIDEAKAGGAPVEADDNADE